MSSEKNYTLLTIVFYKRVKNAKVYIYRYLDKRTGGLTFRIKQRILSSPKQVELEKEFGFIPLCTKFGKTLLQKEFVISEETIGFLMETLNRPIWDYANKMFNYEKIHGTINEEDLNKRRDTRKSIINTQTE